MKIVSDEFKAMDTHGGGYLYFHRMPTSIDIVKQEIDDANQRATARGYSAKQFLITHEVRCVYKDDDGKFLKSETTETAIEYYPQ